MTRAWTTLMTGAKEHCADKVMVHCDDRWHGALCGKGSWIIVVRRAMEHCEDKGHGEF